MKKNGFDKSGLIYKGAMLVFDIFAVNFAYWFALICRFFIAFEFRAGAEKYISILAKVAPFYTVACIAIFAACKLYNTLWKIAGIRDINNIILANIVSTAVFVAGTLLTGYKLPLTIYFIGPAYQLALITASRMGIKLILLERDHIRQKNTSRINAMVVGIQQIGQGARHQIDHSETMVTRCVVDPQSTEKGRMYDGIPVIGGTDQIEKAIEKYQINYVMIADSFLSKETRQQIRGICEEKKIEVVDMTGYMENGSDVLSLVSLLQAVNGPVRLELNGKEKLFANGEAAMLSISGHYVVKRISAKNREIQIELTENPLVPNDTSEDWAIAYKEETGSEVSFF